MFKKSELSTEVGKGPFIFTISALIISALVIVLVVVFSQFGFLEIACIFFMGIILIGSIVVLFGMVSDYSYIKDGKLYMHYLFKGSEIKIKEIGKIKYKDDIYQIYDKKSDVVGTINARAIGAGKIIHELNRNNVPFE